MGSHGKPVSQELLRQAVARFRAGDLPGAERIFRQLAGERPRDPGPWNNLAIVLRAGGRLDEAVVAYHKAIEANRSDPRIHHNLGNALLDRGDHDLAIASYRTSLGLDPSYAEAHNSLGYALQISGHVEDAEVSYRRALVSRPDYAEAFNNLGNALRLQNRVEEAIACYERAVALKPTYANALNNLGVILAESHRLEEALRAYGRAIVIDPDFVAARCNRATALLLRGDLAAGWPEYEWRLKVQDDSVLGQRRTLVQPRWSGQDPAGKRVFVYAEQGLGDTLQFVRYCFMLSARGARVVLECQPELARLIRATPGIETVLSRGEPVPEFDLHAALLSLPLGFETTVRAIPSPGPYLQADPGRQVAWAERVAPTHFRVGIAWAGRPDNPSDRRRSVSLSTLEPLARIAGVKLYSLQKGDRSREAASPREGVEIVGSPTTIWW
ncbi:MAG: tetratricopeptide repeat protein [Candidatus Riflebacteria bacterium]|nr:tetratricopeptide repeat protein [Candidatus Riflebacteria bacterium]